MSTTHRLSRLIAVANMNTRAVTSMTSGSLSSARNDLRNALSRIQDDWHFDCMEAHVTIGSTGDLSAITVPMIHETYKSGEDTSSTEIPIFNRAFDVASVSFDVAMDEDSYFQRKVLVVLLYNFGLCHHINGKQKECSKSLNVAMSMYQGALDVLADIMTDEDEPESQDVILLFLALFHNMANIYTRTYNFEAVRECMSSMKKVIGSDAYCEISWREEDHLFFYLSILVTTSENFFAFAPAA